MKKALLILMLLSSCNNKNQEDIRKVESDTSVENTEIVLQKADSILEQHDRVKEKNLKVLNEVIEKYCTIDSVKIK